MRFPLATLTLILASALQFFSLSALSLTAAPPPPVADGTTFAIIPDTQYYSQRRPELYALQAGWIAFNTPKYNIAAILHVGDITNNNTLAEWTNARRIQRMFDGIAPAFYVTGNHDHGPNGKSATRETGFATAITLDDYRAQKTLLAAYDREPRNPLNTAHLLTAAGRIWLILCLEFAPRDDVVRWANEITAAHPDATAILLTHAYLDTDATRVSETSGPEALSRYGFTKLPGGYNDGDALWTKLVSRHANFALVLCGHITTSAHRADTGVHGNTVHQILTDYQRDPNCGNGWLRLLQIHPDGRTVTIRDYSPLLNETAALPDRAFTIVLDPIPNPKSAIQNSK